MDFKRMGKDAAKTDAMVKTIVKGRVLQYDADFACYEVTDLNEPLATSFKRLLSHIDMKRHIACAETVNAHITLGDKSGREEIATVKPYQENRDPDAPIKVRVRELRRLLGNMPDHDTITTVFDLDYEADDMMTMYQATHVEEYGIDSSVIMSGDKDLWMAQGWHSDAKTGKMYCVNGFGKTTLKDVGNVHLKLVGTGYSWFWHQMIMGDTADNIPGLEKMTNRCLDSYLPLKSRTPRKSGASLAGQAKAIAVLDGVTTSREAALRVMSLYREFYGTSTKDRFIEQAYLLWMQRCLDKWDVLDYLEVECNMKITPSEEQQAAIASTTGGNRELK